MDSTIQVVGMTTNSNRHPIHNYRTDSHHEERNDYIPRGHRYRTADDVQSRLGINDGWLLRYIPSATQETTLGTRISHIFRSYGNYFWYPVTPD